MNVEGSSYTSDRCLKFLNESNWIENIHGIDYYIKENQVLGQGHFGAFAISQESAKRKEPLTAKLIAQWQGLIASEQLNKSSEHPISPEEVGCFRGPSLQVNVSVGTYVAPDWSKVADRIELLVAKINEGLANSSHFDEIDYCKFLGSSFLEFEKIHPFVDGNGRTGRIIANYIATFCGKPILVFQSEMGERYAYYEAHHSEKGMWRHMARKIAEAVVIDGALMIRQSQVEGSRFLYKTENGGIEKIVDLSRLRQAIEEWEK